MVKKKSKTKKKSARKAAKVKRWYRSKKDRMIAGVCGGLADYLGVDPTFVRMLWILITLLYGFGLLLYLIAWLIVPEKK